MRRIAPLLPAILVALWVGVTPHPAFAENIVGPPNAIFCNKVAPLGLQSAGTIQMIVGNTGQVINVCGHVFSGGAAGTIQLEFGTGPTCTSPTVLTPLFTTAAGVNFEDHFSYAWASSSPGQSLCAVITGTSSVSPSVYYSQF